MSNVPEHPNFASPKRIKLDNSVVECKADENHPETSSLGQSETKEELKTIITEFDMFKYPSGTKGNSSESENDVEPYEEDDDDDDDDEDDVSSTVSNVSDLSFFSDMSGQQWKPMANIVGTISWIESQMFKGVSPRVVFNRLTGDSTRIPETISDIALWKVIFSYLTEPPRRSRLSKVTSLDDVIHLLKASSKIIVLTGAGVSVSCGIPDFRSKDGVYSRLAVDFPNLPDPQAMFDINYFRQDPRPFFKFAKEIYPGQFKPSPCHKFIKMLEKHNKLLRNYTQNIDTLEKVAGIENIVECHGSFATASCTFCGYKATCEEIKEEVFNQRIPLCTKCSANADGERGVMKPDIVFFGEGLPDTFHDAMAKDKDECDLLIVIGSSLKVRPVALIPSSLPSEVPQILINRERLPHMNFDVELLGDSDVIVDQLCHVLGGDWQKEICWRRSPLVECTDHISLTPDSSADSMSSDEDSIDDRLSPHDRINNPDGLNHMNRLSPTDDKLSPCKEENNLNESNTNRLSSDGSDRLFLPKRETEENDLEGDEEEEDLITTDRLILINTSNQPIKCQKIGKRHIPGDENTRHISHDSSRDSGIGESSNSSNDGASSCGINSENTFYCIRKRRYIFPGAEVSGITPPHLVNTS